MYKKFGYCLLCSLLCNEDYSDDDDDDDQVAEYGPGTCLFPREPDLDLSWASGSLSRRMRSSHGR